MICRADKPGRLMEGRHNMRHLIDPLDFSVEEIDSLLALAGDLGCSGGPTLAGMVSASAGDDLRVGILAAVVFPVLLLLGLCLLHRGRARQKTAS